jgi:thiamine-monophosphate kinase
MTAMPPPPSSVEDRERPVAKPAAGAAGTLIIVNPMSAGERPLTEDELLGAIRKVLSRPGPGVIVGVGDDAAVVEAGTGEGVLTTDILVEGVHFDRTLTSPRDLGAKAIVANVSDVAAMGASPRHALVSLALSSVVEPPWVMELFGGMLGACEEYAMSVVGGDLSAGPVVVVSVAVTGEVASGKAVTRSGARPGQRLVVTGTLGRSAGGLALARAPVSKVGEVLTSDWGRALLDAHFRPQARVGEGQTLAQMGATAMMDLSDGLALDLSRMCAGSEVGARVDLSSVPVAPELRQLTSVLDADPLELALSGGEDYELLAALPPGSLVEASMSLDERFGVSLTEIGQVVDGSELLAVDGSGNERPLEPRGWDHFAAR